jgi:cysteine dioxygenase
MVLQLRDRMLRGPGGVKRPFTPEEMRAFAASVDLDAVDLSPYRRFQTKCYARNTVVLNEHFELVVICWLPGQMSTIHDHGDSYCLYLVVEGEMTEEQYRAVPGGDPVRTGERRFERGGITIAEGSEVHRIRNAGSDRLVTIHIYSPPLSERVTHYTRLPVAT